MTSLTINALERWVLFGAQWRIVDLSGESAVVDLLHLHGRARRALGIRRPGGDSVLALRAI